MEKTQHPGTITAVDPSSTAARAGVLPGDRLLALNGVAMRDVIDVQIYAAEPELAFLIARDGQQITLQVVRRYGETLGLTFDAELFDGKVRTCQNNCEFCFVTQMAPDMRGPLYIKDDDYRLSFLHGNYITLTNLTERDWERIEDQFLSPLYVSVHATEPDVRVDLMHNPHASAILAQLERLAEMGIEVHTQAVLVPGRNDGPHLDRTIADLAQLYPHVADLTVVPVGLTRWHNARLRPYSNVEAAAVLEQTLVWQTRLRQELGLGFVYPSDEWFLRAGVQVPPVEAYDALLPELVENGVGMVRLFLDGFAALQETLAQINGAHQTWVTGTLFAPVLRACAVTFTAKTGIDVTVLPVANRAFGETVTVAGLLTVDDIVAALAKTSPGDVIVLPGEIFRGPAGQSLDGKCPIAIEQATNSHVYPVTGQNAHVIRT